MGSNASPSRRRGVSLPLVLVFAACVVGLLAILARPDTPRQARAVLSDTSTSNDNPDTLNVDFAEQRQRMVDRQLADRDITDDRVLAAMGRIPRHAFVPDSLQGRAYTDGPLPIGHGQTISQPYIVALMTQLARTKPDARALDIGTGSGYQAAVLAELVESVYSIEILCPLADSARDRLDSLGYTNVHVTCGDGYRGLRHHAPFDVIIVAAAPDHVPEPLVRQLAPGGRLVIPVGRDSQKLMVIKKLPDGTVQKEQVTSVAFVPMTGEAENSQMRSESTEDEPLPPPTTQDGMALHDVLATRRSVRDFHDEPLTDRQLSQLCWAGQGITDPAAGYRAAPSAGALYPITLYVIDARGVFEYQPREHRLVPIRTDDVRRELQRAALGQPSIGDAPALIAITYNPDRLSTKYGDRSERYCLLEAGHVAQNILLQATSMELGSVPVGAFEDDSVARILRLEPEVKPAYLLPVGKPRSER